MPGTYGYDQNAKPIPEEVLARNVNQIRQGRRVRTLKMEEDMSGRMFDVVWVDGGQKECGEVVES